MTSERMLRRDLSGADVRAFKEALFSLGYYDAAITAIRSDRFGNDTLAAVRRFQAAHGLAVDGVAGPMTFSALAAAQNGSLPPANADWPTLPDHIGAAAAQAILPDLASVSAKRQSIVLDALQFAFDPQRQSAFPLSLYIRGANLYNTDLTPYVITKSRIRSGASRQPHFYDGGRQNMMEATVAHNPSVTGADCSGGIVGLMRHAKVVKSGFDLSADGFTGRSHSVRIEQSALRSADFVHKAGHIGLYVGGGYAVEWMGGAYGCQLTMLCKRRGWSFVGKRMVSFGAWTGFYRPSYY